MSARPAMILLALLIACAPAQARDFASTITESSELPRLRPEFKPPDEPGQLFYVQRSPNSNTVVYAARLTPDGAIDPHQPVDAFWRKFNIDGSRQGLNFIERMMAYGVQVDPVAAGRPITFSIAALPGRKLTLSLDAQHRPQALMTLGSHQVKVAYVYLQVVEGGLTPDVPALDIVGTDIASGKAIREHLVQK
jgi:hypothetical protein